MLAPNHCEATRVPCRDSKCPGDISQSVAKSSTLGNEVWGYGPDGAGWGSHTSRMSMFSAVLAKGTKGDGDTDALQAAFAGIKSVCAQWEGGGERWDGMVLDGTERRRG